MRRKAAAILASGALFAAAIAPSAIASPSPPTNGGNGAGSSGQCTGSPTDRPASCDSATNKGPDAVPRS
jgi:hypothetical protein